MNFVFSYRAKTHTHTDAHKDSEYSIVALSKNATTSVITSSLYFSCITYTCF